MQDPASPFANPKARFSLSYTGLGLLVSVALVLFYNLAFFRNVIAVCPPATSHLLLP